MQCEQSLLLVPTYLDGELDEDRAGPLRRHLLECPRCRESAQRGRAQKAWFVPLDVPAVPHGFAARVARLAFDPEAAPLPGLAAVPGPRRLAGSYPGRGEERDRFGAGAQDREGSPRIFSFVLAMTAVAAALLLTFSVGIRMQGRPAGDLLDATPRTENWRQQLEELNRAEAAQPDGSAREKAEAEQRTEDPTRP